jgi:hypothetical protein
MKIKYNLGLLLISLFVQSCNNDNDKFEKTTEQPPVTVTSQDPMEDDRPIEQSRDNNDGKLQGAEERSEIQTDNNNMLPGPTATNQGLQFSGNTPPSKRKKPSGPENPPPPTKQPKTREASTVSGLSTGQAGKEEEEEPRPEIQVIKKEDQEWIDFKDEKFKRMTHEGISTNFLSKPIKIENLPQELWPYLKDSHIEGLMLSYLLIAQPDLISLLANHLKETHIKELDLSSNHMGDELAVQVVNNLPACIEKLSLLNNSITDKGIIKLAGRLRYGLKSLNLGDNRITDKGIIQLAEKSPESLKVLNLSNNQITDKGIMHLVEKLPLKSLNLSTNQITGEGIKKLPDKLPNCEELFIDFNPISGNEAIEVVGKLRDLRAIGLGGINMGNGLASQLAEKLPQLQGLEKLY